MILIKGMVSASRSVVFTLLLLMVLLYIFAIAFTQLTEGNPVISDEGVNYFRTIPQSMYHLLLTGVFLDNLGPVMTDIGNAHPFFAMIFLLFIALAALVVMNMLIGVLCEVVSAVAATEKEEMLVSFVRSQMMKVVKEIDANSNGWISVTEFKQLMVNEVAVRALDEVGVDAEGLVDFSDYIFDPDASPDGVQEDQHGELQISFEKLMTVVLDFRGSNNATVKDILNITKLIKAEFRHLKEVEAARDPLKSPIPVRGLGRSDSVLRIPEAKRQAMAGFAASKSAAFNQSSGSVCSGTEASRSEASAEVRGNSEVKGNSVMLQTQKVEAFLLAAERELRHLTTPSTFGVPGAGTDDRVQDWAGRCATAVSSGLDDLRRLQTSDASAARFDNTPKGF
mmetsp:Transcript_61903/g.157401  ORF Transcript_61903/g.157401 Transcript_61903/m.157401 type:complete len:395 (+) Transcript_61903:1-1185(+)